MQRVKDFGTLLNEMSSSNSFPPGSGSYTAEEAESLEVPEGMDDSKKTVSPRYIEPDAHMNFDCGSRTRPAQNRSQC